MMKKLSTIVIQLACCVMLLGWMGSAVFAAENATGKWQWSMERNGQTMERTVTLNQDGEKLTGTMGGTSGETPITDGTAKDGEIAFTVTRERSGSKFTMKYRGKVEGDELKGKIEGTFGGQERSMDWTAKRVGGTPATVAEEPSREPDVIYVPTPQKVVDKMLELAQVKKKDLVYDLGCGDGRIVVTAAKKFGCKAFGFDIDPERIKESKENVEKNKVAKLVTIQQKDIFTLDLSKVNVVTLYLLPSLNVKLIPQLDKLKPGSRIVSHDFDMEGVTPDKVVTVKDDEEGDEEHTIYLWTTPLKKEKAAEKIAGK